MDCQTIPPADMMSAWTVTDTVTISDLPQDQAVQLGVEGCTFTGLDADMVPVAVSYEPDGPVTQNRVWAIDESTGLLTEPAIDPRGRARPNTTESRSQSGDSAD